MHRLAEELVVPETHRPVKQLQRRHKKCRTPQHVVKRRPGPPRPEGVNAAPGWSGVSVETCAGRYSINVITYSQASSSEG
jgi:hypothetical protein